MSRRQERPRPPCCMLEALIRSNSPAEVPVVGPVLDLCSLPPELLHPESGLGWVRSGNGWRIKD